ncbi:hypothetical protein DFH09DRAFT_1347260, partial [Mycena vulgaris]
MDWMSSLPLRRTRSGREFSAFDLALGRAIPPPVPFDVGQCLQQRMAEQEATGAFDEDDEEDATSPAPQVPSTATPASTPAPAPPPAPTPPRPPPASTSLERSKGKSKTRRDRKRNEARAASSNPLLKSVHRKRIDEAKASALELDLDAATLPHSKPAWLGSRAAGEEDFDFTDAAAPHDLSSTGLGGVSYTQEEVDALSATAG